MRNRLHSIAFCVLILSTIGCRGQVDQLTGSGISIEDLQLKATITRSDDRVGEPTTTYFDFRKPAKKVMPGVVHIVSTYESQKIPRRNFDIPDFFKDFFGDDFSFDFRNPDQRSIPRMGSGSGVIITDDGYVLSNNHVIDQADEIKVTLSDNRTFSAKVIGTDPATDLALLKVDQKGLSFVTLGNSDVLEIGEWVLAVGNPFNLSTTVTAGIVSAKARNINIIQDQASIESFIQTDAAVNPGNSGGALVNLQGELVGINTAIASPTGAYAGYSFAIPVNIAKKVVDDLLNYGEVQRAYLGVFIRNLDGEMADELGLESTEGVYIDSLVAGGTAEQAGIMKGDVILKIDGEEVGSSPRLQEIIGGQRPGDKVSITLVTKQKERTIEVQLKGKGGEKSVVKKEKIDVLQSLGIDIEDLTTADRENWQISGSAQVTRIYPGIIRKSTDMREGFIITKVDKKPVSSANHLVEILRTRSGGVMVEGFYPSNQKEIHFYAFGL